MPPVRFYDTRTELFHHSGSALVHCPRCDRLARRERRTCHEARVVCRSCGFAAVGGRVGRLWLEADTRHGTIWAYNLEHLTVLRNFVAAGLREHAPWHEHRHRCLMLKSSHETKRWPGLVGAAVTQD
ncbi:hypothetical protein, partial [Streptomyces sp. 4F14]|uniref:hypothetical protein n=1 Tax=Streptomyces sp. 4F14 TaxID=3394380 RepID=UPI003A88C803